MPTERDNLLLVPTWDGNPDDTVICRLVDALFEHADAHDIRSCVRSVEKAIR